MTTLLSFLQYVGDHFVVSFAKWANMFKGIFFFYVGLYEALVSVFPAVENDQLSLCMKKQCGVSAGNRL